MHTRARGQNNKVHTEGTKADTNIFRLNALYQRKTMSDYGRYGIARNYGSLEEHKSVFSTVLQHNLVGAPLKERVVQTKLYYNMNERPLFARLTSV